MSNKTITSLAIAAAITSAFASFTTPAQSAESIGVAREHGCLFNVL